MIGIIDYDAGNAPSVASALTHLGHPSMLVTSPSELRSASRLILPGVGSARATLESLSKLDLLQPFEQRVRRDAVPFLGICVGLQILFDHSEEGDVPCLGWLSGRVRKFAVSGLRIPQIGWNTASRLRDHPVLQGLPEHGYYYFVNSYCVSPDDPTVALCSSDYGIRFASMVAHRNIVAAQFHVEKSGPLGLRILDNFARLQG